MPFHSLSCVFFVMYVDVLLNTRGRSLPNRFWFENDGYLLGIANHEFAYRTFDLAGYAGNLFK